jgi:hypothetical protein
MLGCNSLNHGRSAARWRARLEDTEVFTTQFG